eukprot:TRINITY_DN1426_c0_g4_i1.p1 TRINITY_DN1426_c0_g4~~TRINITY_DN1426_c0_g4_i1.p1  ORF type:complete len:387 (+),score=61.88 TRINITY_DN1426_c0_g4_i1:222-1382(+)
MRKTKHLNGFRVRHLSVFPPPPSSSSVLIWLQKENQTITKINTDTVPEDMSPEELHQTVCSLMMYTSETANVDTPLCQGCYNALTWGRSGLNEQLNQLQADITVHVEQHRQLQLEDMLAEERGRHCDSELRRLSEEEQRLNEEIEEIEREERLLSDSIREKEEEHARITNDKNILWTKLNELAVDETNLNEQRENLINTLSMDDVERQRLCKTNMLNESFHIWCDGHFGTINKLRLGKLVSQPVDHNEMNAAWGYCAQLLVLLLSKWKVSTSRYQVHPMGNFSTVRKHGSKQHYELWAGATGLWASARYDNGMAGFLCCVDELCRHCLSRIPPGGSIPFNMNEDRISNYSIRLTSHGQSDENWTKALKCMLINLKWVISMTAAHLP